MKTRLWKKLFLLTLVLLFLLPGCGQNEEEMVTVYCLKEIDYGTGKTIYNYDEMGNVLEYPHSSTGHTVCTYDENNNTLTSDYYLSDTLIESTVCTYDEQGRILTKTVTEQSGISEYTYTYDTSGNLASETITSPNRPYQKTVYSYTYDDDGTLIQSVSTSYDKATALASKEIKTFDAEGRPLLQESYSGGDSTLESNAAWSYDSKGNLLTEEYNYSSPNYPSRKTQWEYDRKGRCLSESSYRDGELFNRKLYSYDKKGNLLETQEDLEVKGQEKRKYYRTEYTYDRKGNTLSEKTYYSFNRNWEVFHQHLSYSYDKKGNLLEEIRLTKEGDFITGTFWTYDKAGNMRSKTYKASKDHAQISTYDENGNLICYEWSHSNGSAKITYSYITFELPRHLAEKVQHQQEAVFEALEYSQIG